MMTVEEERDKYRKALEEIGKLTRWVGWMELRDTLGAEDMRRIAEIVREVTGLSYPEYT